MQVEYIGKDSDTDKVLKRLLAEVNTILDSKSKAGWLFNLYGPKYIDLSNSEGLEDYREYEKK